MSDESPLSKEDFAADDTEQPADTQSEGAFDPKVQTLLDQADQILTAELDPLMRDALSADPEKLAEWDALMQEYARVAAEDQAAIAAAQLTTDFEWRGLDVDPLYPRAHVPGVLLRLPPGRRGAEAHDHYCSVICLSAHSAAFL